MRWQGRCPDCGQWNTMHEEQSARASLGMVLSVEGTPPVELGQVELDPESRWSTGIGELDRVLGGGLVAGSLVLLGGAPGIGKSTLLLQMARHLAGSRPPILYVSGEESARQIRLRAERLQSLSPGILIQSETRLEAIDAQIRQTRPALVFIDSVQTLYRSDLSPAPGSVTQVRECSASLMRVAKSQGCPIVLVGHVTKGGQIAGPRVLEHLVDTVLYFEGDGMHNVRVLRSVKNRFGGTQEVGLFRMTASGLDPIPDASAFFLSQRAASSPGSLVFPSMEGSRPLLVEVQA
ncbi:MAG: DNA repair protein RadA, partial [Candidatus Eremiobacterota bacterium]